MRKQRFRNLAMMLFAALVLTSAGQAWAAVTGTEAGTTVSNTASVNFTINGNTSSKTSTAVDFLIDRKIRVVVNNFDSSNQVYAIPGATGIALSFDVTNLSNTIEGSTEYFYLEIQDGTGGTFSMTGAAIYEDLDRNGVPDGAALTGDNLVVTISNAVGSNTNTYLIVADAPAGATIGQIDDFNLVATAWEGATVAATALDEDAVGATPGTNDHDESEIVFADDATAGDYAADVAEDGRHSDLGSFVISDPFSIEKSVGDGASGYHLPGDTVTYTITVRNSDTAFDASLVTISDNIPPEVVYNAGSLTCPDVSFDPQWFTAADAWAAADSSSATAVRCFEGDVLRAPGVGTPTEATMSFDVDIP